MHLEASGAFQNVAVIYPYETDCTLDLVDSYGDGWNGNQLVLLGESYTVASGFSASFDVPLLDPDRGTKQLNNWTPLLKLKWIKPVEMRNGTAVDGDITTD